MEAQSPVVWVVGEVMFGLISIVLVVLWWWIRSKTVEIEALKDKLAALELEMARDYATKRDLSSTRTEIKEAIDSFGKKLDRLVEMIHNKVDRSEL
jgi:uncharacterized coiled-coil protein SlyX